VFETINQFPSGMGVVVVPVMHLGHFLAIPILALGVLLITERRRIALDLALGGVTAWLLSRLVKEIVERGRPGDLLAELTLRGHQESGYGFVSGHTAVAFAMATVAVAYVPTKGRVLIVALATTVALGRIYVGAHLPLDIVGGAAMGWAVGSLVHLVGPPEVIRKEELPTDLSPERKWGS
jgi:membrane-associated phospholipid phosphatase